MLDAVKKWQWYLALLCLAIFLILLETATYSLGTACPHSQAPSQQEQANNPSENPCTFRESLIGRLIVWTGNSVDADQSPLAAAAACVLAAITFGLAIFTGLLWRSPSNLVASAEKTAREQLTHARDVERAYLNGGGGITVQPGGNLFRIEVSNYGKTPAELTWYCVEFATLAQVRASLLPVHQTDRHWDPIAPGTASKLLNTRSIPVHAQVVYGAFWYRDIWREREHKSRFILTILPNNTLSNVTGVDRGYTEWD